MDRPIKVLNFDFASGDFTADYISRPVAATALKPSAGTIITFARYVHDALLFVVACAEHSKALLFTHRSPYLFVPFFPLRTSKFPFLKHRRPLSRIDALDDTVS